MTTPALPSSSHLVGDMTHVGDHNMLALAAAAATYAANNLSDVADAGSSRANIHVPVLTPAACVATVNVVTMSGPGGATTIASGSNGVALPQATINIGSSTTLSTSGTVNVVTGAGTQAVTYTGVTSTTLTGCSGGTGTMSTGGAVTATFDGYLLAATDTILLAGQTTASQNGPWLIPVGVSGAWTRPTEFATGAIVKGRSIQVAGGSSHGGSLWVMETTTAVTVDTTATTWGQANSTSQNTFTASQTIYVPSGGAFGVSNTAASAASARVPFRSTMLVPSSAGGAENFVLYALNAQVTGDFTSPSPAPTDPGYVWGGDFFSTTGTGSTDGNGISNYTGWLLENAVRSGSGSTYGSIVGAAAQAYFYEASAHAAATNIMSFNVIPPANLSGASGVATNAYGIYIGEVDAGAAGSTNAYSLFVAGGISKVVGCLQVFYETSLGDDPLVIKNAGGTTVSGHSAAGNIYGYIFSVNAQNADILASNVAATTTSIYNLPSASRSRPKFVGPNGNATTLGETQWEKSWVLGTPNGSTAAIKFGGMGNGGTTGTQTVISATATNPLMINIACAASTNSVADVSTNGNFEVFIGSATDYYAGFDYHFTGSFPDASYTNTGASTGSRIVAGLSSTTTSTFGSDRGGSNSVIAFYRSNVNGGATDTNFVFVTNNASASTAAATGMAFTPGDMYHFHIWCPAGSTTVYWQVDDLTAATTQAGSATADLPSTTTALCALAGVLSVDATARNIRVRDIWLTTDRG